MTLEKAEFYDNLWANEWRDMEIFNPTARHLQRFIRKALARIGAFESLLDVGCGIGTNIQNIRRYQPTVPMVGTDISPEVIRMARHYVGPDANTSFDVLDVTTGALDRTFDVVLCNQVLEHIEDDSVAIRNIAAMCRRYLIITVPGGKFNSTSKLVGHHRHYSKQQLVRLVQGAGMDIVSAEEWGFPFHSLYKIVLGALPPESQKKMGFGAYGFFKKALSHAIYLLYFANVLNAGANVLLVARRPETK